MKTTFAAQEVTEPSTSGNHSQNLADCHSIYRNAHPSQIFTKIYP